MCSVEPVTGVNAGSCAVVSSAHGLDDVVAQPDRLIRLPINIAVIPKWFLKALISKVDSPYLSVVFRSLADKLKLMKQV